MKRLTMITLTIGFILVGFTLLEAQEAFVFFPSYMNWEDTGLDFNQGEEVTIMATGFWAGDPENDYSEGGVRRWTDPVGIEFEGKEVAPWGRCLTDDLIGRIDDKIFYIGGGETVEMPASGRLYLQVADPYPAGNNEYIAVAAIFCCYVPSR